MRILILLLLISTASAAQIKDTTQHFYLIGSKSDFQLLYKSVTDPDNITRKQASDIARWLMQAQLLITDTTGMKMEADKNDSLRTKLNSSSKPKTPK